MNKVYKVVWNKARNCYVVASEFAKSHTKSHSGSTKRVRVGTTAALMAVAVLTGFAMPAQAAVSIGTDGTVKAEAADINALNNLLKNGVTTNKDGSVTVGGLTVKKNGEVSVNSPDVVYGKNAKIIWDSNNTMGQISIGNNATAITGRGGQEKAFAYDGDYNHAAGAIAIGANTYARTGSIMIGSHVYKGNMGDVKNIDTDSFNTGSDGAYGFTVNSTTIGTNSFTRGNLATTIGDYNIQSGRSVGYGSWNALNYGAQNFGATVIGALNSNESQSDIVSSYIGTSTSGVANSIVGVANRVNSSNGTLVFGAGNEVTHSLSDIYGVGDTTSLKDAKKAQDALKNAVAESNAGGAVLAIGGANKADWARKSQLIGVGNTLTGASSAVSEYNMINGYKNEVTNATHTSIIGSNNNARDVQATTVMGDNNALTGNGNHVIGDNHKVTGENNILIGNNKEQETHGGNDSVIIGNNASAGNGSMVMGNKAHAGNTGIALGMNASAGDGQNLAIGYYARVSGAKNSTALGYASSVEKRDILPSDSENGVISVGKSVGQSGEAGITRRIINVKAGVNDTDAVNVSQLKGVKAEALKHSTVTNGDANITVTEGLNKDGGKEYKVALNNDITLAGDDPDAFVSISGSKGTIWTSGSVTAGSVAVGTAKADGTTPFFVDSNGAFYAADGKFSVDKDGNANANSIQTNALNSKYNLSVGTANVNGTMPFFVNSNGAFYAANGKLVVDKDGKLVAPEAELGKVTIDKDGKISGVAAGAITADSTDAVNGSQLHAVATEAGKHSTVTNGDANITVTEGLNKDGGKEYKVALNNDITLAGDDPDAFVSISGSKGTIWTSGSVTAGSVAVGTAKADGTTPFFVDSNGAFYAADGKFSVDKDGNANANSIQTNALNSKYNLSVGTANVNGTMPFFVNSNGAFYAANGKLVVDKDGKLVAPEAELGKVTIDKDGKISGVAAGAVTADSTDAVNGSQLHAVATEAGKHSKVVNGSNINVEEFDNDGQKIYKVNLNKDIMLGDLTGKYVNISGTNGTIETTGYIATNDRVYADKGAKLADIDVTGDKISNGASSIVLDGSNVEVNDKVTIDQNGKISGVAAGEISSTSTDAINGSQLHQTNENVAANRADIDKNKADIAALDNRVTQNEADIAANRADIDKNKADIAANRTDIDKNAADIAQNKTDIKNLDNRVTNVEELAKKHTTVTQGDNITVTEGLNADGGKEYNVALDKDINLDSVTTGQTSISNDGLKVNGKTYVSDSGLNANDQKITNVADGKVEKGSTDAVNGGQLYNETRVAKDGNFVKKSNTAGENLSALDNQVTANTESIYHMNGRISDLDNRVNKVGAGAAALAALHPLDFDPDAKWDFAAGYGNYRGANAAAVGAYYRPNEDTMFSVGGTFGNGENMVNAGVSFKLGSGSSHVSTSRVAMAKEIKELRGELEAMKSAMLDANAGKKIDTSKLQLFPDVSQNHWAYEYVAQLAGNGMIEGYPDGNFAGDRPMTRYEFAAILYRAMAKGAVLSDKILSEFSHELEYFTVDTIAKDKAGNPTIQRVRTVKENKNK